MKIEDYIAPNIKSVPPSGIRKFFDLVNEMPEAISLSIGEPDFVTPKKMTEAGIDALQKGQTFYSPSAGFIEVRQEISKYLERKYLVQYNPVNEVVVTVGGSEAIDLAIRAVVLPGDEVIIPEPNFVAYRSCVLFSGAVPVTIELKEEDEFRLKKEALLAAITPKTKMLILSYPNNPTGAVMTKQDLDEIVEVLKDRDIFVLTDEIYAELSYGFEHVSIASYPEMKDKTIFISGFSKAFAMTGWRLGYVCGHRDLMGAMLKMHQYVMMCAPTVAQYAAMEGLRSCEDDVAQMRTQYDTRRKFLLDTFERVGLQCFEPKGAFYAFPNIQSTGMTSTEFCERFLQEEKVAVVPGNAFGACGEGFIRVCYAYSMESLKEAMIRLERFIGKIS